MKKNIIFTVISILSFQFLIAQNYIPLAVEGTHWVVKYNENGSVEPVDDLWEYFCSGDTIIENLNYKKVFKRDLVVIQEGPPFEAEGPYELFGYLRDDSITRKVYAIQNESYTECPENSEFLLYDFSLNVGDTADFCLLLSFMDNIVTSIDPEVRFGFETNVYSTDYFDQYQYYEGMGSVFGLFESMFIPVGSSKKQTYGVSSLYFYCRESPCWLFVSAPEKLEAESINLFPNPAHDFIYVSNKNEDINSISVFNNVGQEVIRKSGNLNKIDVRELNPGLYIIEMTINKTRIQKKIIIE